MNYRSHFELAHSSGKCQVISTRTLSLSSAIMNLNGREECDECDDFWDIIVEFTPTRIGKPQSAPMIWTKL